MMIRLISVSALLALTWSRSSGGSSHYYVFELHRASSSSGSFTRHATANDSSSTTAFSEVTRDRYYKARGKRCTTSGRSSCGGWSSWSSTVRVLPLPQRPSNLNLTRSTDDLTLTYTASSWAGTGNYYKFELHRATASGGTYSSYRSANDEVSPLAFNDVKRGYWYKVRGTRCTDAARTDCAAWPNLPPSSSAVQVPELPNPPTLGTVTVSGDDLSVAYTASTWSDGSTSYYQFEAHKSATQAGSFTKQTAVNDDVSPASITNLPEGWYKVRGRRCIDAARTECGGWSALTSSAVQVTRSAPPPTALALTLSGDNDLELTYTQSSWTGQTTHFYEFELLRSETSSGTYGEYEDDDDRASPLDFDAVHTGYYYRARGKRCASAGTSCGSWSNLSLQLNVPAKTTYTAPTLSTPTVSGDMDDITVAFSKSTVSALRTHHYVIDLHRADTASGTFTSVATVMEDSTPATFEDIDRSKVYKARAKRCKSEDGKVCGPWSSFTSVWDAPSPPSGVTLSLTRPNTLSATYTRSTFPVSSTHRYQFKLIRSETSGGTYIDYGNIVNTTSTVSFGTVHTGYHYKAVGRRCRTASSDCGEWSSITVPTAVNVPVTTATPPTVVSTTLSTQGDDVTVNISTGASGGPSGQAADPDPNPVPSYYAVDLMRSSSSSDTYSFYASASASASSATFTDVDTGWNYKARARACAATTRKLCGAWSPLSAPLNVPAPSFPSLAAPTLAIGPLGSINASFSPASATYYYRLTLRWSETGKDYRDQPNPALLSHTDNNHTFTGMEKHRGGYYMAALYACSDSKRRTCGPPVSSNVISLPEVTISNSTPTDVLSGAPAFDLSVTVSNFDKSAAYAVVISVTNAGDKANVLRLTPCNPDSSDTGTTGPKRIGSGRTGKEFNGTVATTLRACATGRDTVTARLMLNSVTYAYDTYTITSYGKPTGLRANGHSLTSSKGRLTLRWDYPDIEPTRYEYRYALHTTAEGAFIDEADITWTTIHAGSANTEAVKEGLGIGRLYRVQVQAVKGSIKSGWSDPVYATISMNPPSFNSRTNVARIGLSRVLAGSNYTYTICSDTFLQQHRNEWLSEIRKGMNLWPSTVRWIQGSLNIVRVTEAATVRCLTDPDTSARPNEIRRVTHDFFTDNCYVGLSQGCAYRSPTGGLILLRAGGIDSRLRWHFGTNYPSADCSRIQQITVHEAGHIFGLKDSPGAESVMDDPDCIPMPYDVAAVMRLYQSP